MTSMVPALLWWLLVAGAAIAVFQEPLFLLVVPATAALMVPGWFLERRAWNSGRCRQCNETLHYFDTDSQGGRGYKCDGCGRSVWVSYPYIDAALSNTETE